MLNRVARVYQHCAQQAAIQMPQDTRLDPLDRAAIHQVARWIVPGVVVGILRGGERSLRG